MVCPFCNVQMTPEHCVVCKMAHSAVNKRHDNVVIAFASLVSKKKKCRVVCL